MSINAIDAKIKIKGTSISNDVPVIGPSGDHTDGTWSSLDVYDRELFINTTDDRMWIGENEIAVLAVDGTSAVLPFSFYADTGGINTTSPIPTFGTHYNDGLYSSVLGGDNNTVSSSNYSSVLGGQLNDTGGFDNVHILGSSITATADNATYVESLMNEDSGIILRKKIINIGDWDMVTDDIISVTHGLSATEWKTIRNICAVVRNDNDDEYFDLSSRDSSGSGGSSNGSTQGFDSLDIRLLRAINGRFNNILFDSTSYNRGWINFEYTPD